MSWVVRRQKGAPMRKDVWRLVPLLTVCFAVLALAVFFIGDFGCAQREDSRRARKGAQLNQIVSRLRQVPADPVAMEELAAFERHQDSWDRTVMFAAMRQVGPAVRGDARAGTEFTRVLLPVIRRGLGDPDGFVRREAALAAGAFGRLSQPAVPELIGAMRQHPGEDTGLFAAEAAGRLGPAAQEAIPAVEEVGRVWRGDEIVGLALRRLRGQESVPE